MTSPSAVDLARLVGFTAEDLAANRAGRLSDAQRTKLESYRASTRRAARASAFIVPVVLVAVVVAVAVILSKQKSHGSAQASSGTGAVIPAVVGAVVLIFVITLLARRRSGRLADLKVDGTAHRVAGAATTKVTKINTGDVDGPSVTTLRYDLRVGGVRFQLPSRAALDAIPDGASLTVYFAGSAKSNHLLSLEPSA